MRIALSTINLIIKSFDLFLPLGLSGFIHAALRQFYSLIFKFNFFANGFANAL